MGRRATIQAETDTRISNPLQAPSGSVFPGRDLVPEERLAGRSGGSSLLGRERSQEAFEFPGEEPGWGSTLGELPEIEVSEDSFNDVGLFDDGDDLEGVTTLRALWFIMHYLMEWSHGRVEAVYRKWLTRLGFARKSDGRLAPEHPPTGLT